MGQQDVQDFEIFKWESVKIPTPKEKERKGG